MNDAIFKMIYGQAGQFPALDTFAAVFSQNAHWLVAALLLVYWLKGNQKSTIFALFTVMLALLFGQIIGTVYSHPRPFMADAAVHSLIPHAADSSFPSDHALASFSLAFAIWRTNRKWGVGLLALAVMIGLGRIFVGVHYPADIAGGAVAALLAALAVIRAERLLEPVAQFILKLYRKWFPFPGANDQPSHSSKM